MLTPAQLWRSYGPYLGSTAPQAADLASPRDLTSVAESRPLLEAVLLRNIIPAWYPGCVDGRYGGYDVNMDANGRRSDDGTRHLIGQTRTLWFLSRLARSAYGNPEHLAAARHGFEFLAATMWDARHGGFFWEVTASGEVLRGDKDSYGQAFALLALSEYATISGDHDAMSLAGELFETLETRIHDPKHPGYFEMRSRDWSATPERGYVGQNTAFKTMNPHLHLMEAMTSFYRLTQAPLVRARLEELVNIQRNLVYAGRYSAGTELHELDWSPAKGRWNRVCYAHDLENIYLLLDADAALDLPVDEHLRRYGEIIASCLRHGFDRKQGGFYYWGRHGLPATRRHKAWWVQAESLLALLQMYQLTGNSQYGDCYLETLDWIVTRQVDWAHGEWYAEIAPNGRPNGGAKGDPLKCCYHTGRAMLAGIELIDRL